MNSWISIRQLSPTGCVLHAISGEPSDAADEGGAGAERVGFAWEGDTRGEAVADFVGWAATTQTSCQVTCPWGATRTTIESEVGDWD